MGVATKSRRKPLVIGLVLLLFGALLTLNFVLRPWTLPCRSSDFCPDGVCVYRPGCDQKFGFCVQACGAMETSYCDCEGNKKTIGSTCIKEPYAESGRDLFCEP